MARRGERWRPAGEAPECEPGRSVRVVVEHDVSGYYDDGPCYQTEEGWYANAETWHEQSGRPEGVYTGFHFASERGGEACFDLIDRVTRWRYFPEPPTAEEEARRGLEERVLADLIKAAELFLEAQDDIESDPSPTMDSGVWFMETLEGLRNAVKAAKGGQP